MTPCSAACLWFTELASLCTTSFLSLALYVRLLLPVDNDFVGDVVDADVDELGSFLRCHEVEIRYVDRHESCSLGGYDTVKRSLVTSMSAVGVVTAPR